MPAKKAEKKTKVRFHSWFGGFKCECGKSLSGNFYKTEFSCPKCEKSYRLVFLDENDQPVEVEMG